MVEHFLSVYTSGAISGGLAVIPTSATYNVIYGTWPIVVVASSVGGAIGIVEPFGGNNDSSFDSGVTSTMPATIRLFAPLTRCSITGVATTGTSAGIVVYYAVTGQVSTTGTITAGITLDFALSNGDLISIAKLL